MAAEQGTRKKTVYTVDDEHYTIHLWLECEEEGTFPGVVLDGTDNLATAVRYVNDSHDPTVYVLDARIPVNPDIFSLFRDEILRRTHIDIKHLPADNLLNGLYAGAWIKLKRPKSRVILLTAFRDHLSELGKNLDVHTLMSIGCDRLLGKRCSSTTVKETVGAFIKEVD